MHKDVHLIDLVKSFPTKIWLRKLAPIQLGQCGSRFASPRRERASQSSFNLQALVDLLLADPLCLLDPREAPAPRSDPAPFPRYRRDGPRPLAHRGPRASRRAGLVGGSQLRSLLKLQVACGPVSVATCRLYSNSSRYKPAYKQDTSQIIKDLVYY